MAANPFTPTFGAPPPLLVGRDDVLDDFQDPLDEGPGSPRYVTLFTGGRGVGKTVMLNAAEDVAREARFVVISETASDGFVERLTTTHLPKLLPRQRRRVESVDLARAGAGAARRRVGRLVIEPALNDLSAVDRTFLLRMAVDDGPSKTSDIGERMGADVNYISQYRLRLIAAGMISAVGHGRVDFALPNLREWLREHAAIDT